MSQYLKTLGKLSDGPMSFVPWYDPNKKLSMLLDGALAKAHPGVNLNTNHVLYVRRRCCVAADAYKRAGSTDPKGAGGRHSQDQYHRERQQSAPAFNSTPRVRTTSSRTRRSRTRGGKLLTVAPKAASNAKPELPMTSYTTSVPSVRCP